MSDGVECKQKLVDRGAGAVVRQAVAVGLRQHLAPDNAPMPSALQRLLDELRRQDAAAREMSRA